MQKKFWKFFWHSKNNFFGDTFFGKKFKNFFENLFTPKKFFKKVSWKKKFLSVKKNFYKIFSYNILHFLQNFWSKKSVR